jgi:two-component sensor histidine kinase
MKVDILEILDSHRSHDSSEYLLVRELTHRINNEFASMIGLVSLVAARSADGEVRNALNDVVGLLHNHASVHRALEMPAFSTVIDASDYIRVLCQSIRSAKLDERNIELMFVEHPLDMPSERCWRLGMIVSELIANSVRHAFDRRGGTIRVELSSSGSIAQCCVSDNGSSQGPYSSGNGLRIVEELSRELNGEIVHQFGTDGAKSILIFPSRSDTSADNPPIADSDERPPQAITNQSLI